MRWTFLGVARGAVLAALMAGSAQARPPPDPGEVVVDRAAVDREAMVKHQIAARGVKNPRVLEAMREVPRHLFVPESQRASAYEDRPLPIGEGQTISQPYIVAVMTELIDPKPEHKVLEVGTGSGYQAAVLGRLVKKVVTIEIVEPLAKSAAETLKKLGRDRNVTVIAGDGYAGVPAEAPFDAIIVTAAPPEIPKPLIDQLKVGGKMVIPVGEEGAIQDLQLLEKTKDGLVTKKLFEVRFVPMTGRARSR